MKDKIFGFVEKQRALGVNTQFSDIYREMEYLNKEGIVVALNELVREGKLVLDVDEMDELIIGA